MPAASCRIMPARSISRWDAISASLGVSRKLGRKYRDRRMKLSGKVGWRGLNRGTKGRNGGGITSAGRGIEHRTAEPEPNGPQKPSVEEVKTPGIFLRQGGGNRMTSI